MATAVQEPEDAYLEVLAEVEKDLPARDTPWVRDLRDRARQAYSDLPFPTKRMEDWKYTSTEDLRKTAWTLAPDAGDAVSRDDVAPFLYDLDAVELVTVNGRFSRELSRLDDLPEGVTVASLRDALEGFPERLEPHLGRVAAFEASKLAAYNTAFLRDGAVVLVDDGAVVERPIHVVHVAAGGDEPTIAPLRNLVVAGESSEVTVLESYVGLDEGVHQANVVTEVAAGANAKVDHLKLQRSGPDAFHVQTLESRQARDAFVRTSTIDLGARWVRNDLTSTFEGEGGEGAVLGLYVLRDHQHVDNHTVIEHAVPRCDSRELYKGILDDESRGAFLGRIHVHEGAQQTDAYQHNPNMLLSKGALVNTRPQLEIFADDVRCSHGSTIGQIDEEWIFYLRSRGLDRETARSLLIFAFAEEIIERVPVPEVREALEELILARLPHGDRVREAL